MMDYEKIGEISVAKILRDFIGDEVLPGTDIGAGQFWSGLAGLVGEFAPRIRDQLRFRDELQEKIDESIALPWAGRSTRQPTGTFFARSVILSRSRPILPFAPKMS